MKKLKIPEYSDEYIEISDITDEFKGLAIAYKDNKPIGYIQYFGNVFTWGFITSIDDVDYDPDFPDDSFSSVIKYGIVNKIFDEVKIIEFV